MQSVLDGRYGDLILPLLLITIEPARARVLEAAHFCMFLRGTQAVGTRTRTSAFRGVLLEAGRHRERLPR